MTATTLHDVALVTAARGDRNRRVPLSRGHGHPSEGAGRQPPARRRKLNSLSRVLRDQGRDEEAAAALEEALRIARPALGSDHQLIAIYSINLASVHLARREPAAAEPLLRDAVRIRALAPQLVPNRRRIAPDDDWSVGAAKSLLGATLTA